MYSNVWVSGFIICESFGMREFIDDLNAECKVIWGLP